MPEYIVRLTDEVEKKMYYMLWSTVTETPICEGMPLELFKEYYKNHFGTSKNTLTELKERLERVAERGTSSRTVTVEDLIKVNHCGPNETTLTLEQILDKYCRKA